MGTIFSNTLETVAPIKLKKVREKLLRHGTRAVTITALPLHRGNEMPTAVLSNTVRGAKGQIFVVYLLGIRYHCLVILHLN